MLGIYGSTEKQTVFPYLVDKKRKNYCSVLVLSIDEVTNACSTLSSEKSGT